MKLKLEKHIIKNSLMKNKKILLISDLHDYGNNNYDNLINNAKKLNPNYILIVGDLVYEGSFFEKNKVYKNLLYLFKSLSLISIVIISLGNHDYYYDYPNKIEYDLKIFKELDKINNIIVLNNKNITFDNIDFYGISFFDEESKNLDKEFSKLKIINSSNYKILLCHNPLVFSNLNYSVKYDLVVSGHMHNGLFFTWMETFDFKKNGLGLISPNRKLFPKYTRGKHKINNSTLIIGKGYTKLPEYNKLFKLFNSFYTKHITIIEFI